ncbi:hypothetical protein PRUPE_1G245000 [Prunus persica]|uniref:Uncharacterized protein n=1 Tax=Prunus persica TaxID=3760 RepID=A0A251R2Q9_PRUPE|nr:hypothetical protein PRUPE_1G245000 [Prunus persica]
MHNSLEIPLMQILIHNFSNKLGSIVRDRLNRIYGSPMQWWIHHGVNWVRRPRDSPGNNLEVPCWPLQPWETTPWRRRCKLRGRRKREEEEREREREEEKEDSD